jgi:hypothetical protein
MCHFMCCVLCFQASKWSSEEWAVTRSNRVAINLNIRAHISTERTLSDGFCTLHAEIYFTALELTHEKSQIFQLDSASTQTRTANWRKSVSKSARRQLESKYDKLREEKISFTQFSLHIYADGMNHMTNTHIYIHLGKFLNVPNLSGHIRLWGTLSL